MRPFEKSSLRLMALALVWVGFTFVGRGLAQEPRLFYEQDGEGPTVVLVEEWGHDTSSWFLLLPTLRPDHRLVRYDLRGQGRSQSAADGDYSIDAHVSDLLRIVSGLDIEELHLVGAGFGATIALAFARAHPDRLRSLSLINPRLVWSEDGRRWWRRFLDAYDRVGKPSVGAYSSVLVERWFGTGYVNRNPWVLSFYDLMFRRQSAGSLIEALEEWLATSMEIGQGQISATPLLIIRSERSMEFQGEPGIMEVFPDARRVRLRSSGAIPQIDAATEVGDHLRRFIAARP